MVSEYRWRNVRKDREERKKRREERELEVEQLRRLVVERFMDYGRFMGIGLRRIEGVKEGVVEFQVEKLGKRIRLYIQEVFGDIEWDEEDVGEVDLVLFGKPTCKNNIGITLRGCGTEEMESFVKKFNRGRANRVVVNALPTPNISLDLLRDKEAA